MRWLQVRQAHCRVTGQRVAFAEVLFQWSSQKSVRGFTLTEGLEEAKLAGQSKHLAAEMQSNRPEWEIKRQISSCKQLAIQRSGQVTTWVGEVGTQSVGSSVRHPATFAPSSSPTPVLCRYAVRPTIECVPDSRLLQACEKVQSHNVIVLSCLRVHGQTLEMGHGSSRGWSQGWQ